MMVCRKTMWHGAALALLISSSAAAATWIGDGTDTSWAEATNWSGGVPGTAESAVFDGTGTGDCIVSAEVDYIPSLALNTGYTGTITLNANLTIHGTCTLTDTVGRLAIADNMRLILRGSGDLLIFSGGALGVGGGAVVFESDATTTINIPAGGTEYNTHGIVCSADSSGGAVTVTFQQQGDLIDIGSFVTETGANEGHVIYYTNGHELDGTDWASFYSAENANGDTTVYFDASTVYFPNIMHIRGDGDVLHLEASTIRTNAWWPYTENVVVNPGTSSVTVWGDVGAEWVAHGPTLQFYDLTLNEQVGQTASLQLPIEVANDLTVAFGTFSTECRKHPPASTTPYKLVTAEPVTVKGNVTVAAGASIVMQHTSGTSILTLDGGATQTLTDGSGSTWGDIVIDNTTSVTLAGALNKADLTINTGCTLDLDESDLTGGGTLSNDGTIIQTGNETVTVGADGDSGTWQIIGSSGGASGGLGGFTIPNLSAAGADFFDLAINCASNNAFIVDAGDLRIAGDLHIDNAATLTFSATDSTPVLRIDGTFTGNQANITDVTRLIIQGGAGNELSVDVSLGNIGTGAADVPDYITFKNLMSPGVTCKADRTMTWTGLVFSGLNDTHANGAHYLSVGDSGFVLTLADIVFNDIVAGVDGNGVFDTATDPGTIASTNTTIAPAVNITAYTVVGLTYGGTETDTDAGGTLIVWPPLDLSPFALLTPADATPDFAPLTGTFTWEASDYVATYTVHITDGGSFTLDETGILTESFTPGPGVLDYDTPYTWSVTAINAFGTMDSTGADWTFTTKSDDDDPTVQVTLPADGATGVAVSTTISVTFSEDMAAGTDADFHLLAGGIEVTGTATHVGDTVTFEPDVDLTNGTTYTITVDATAEDLAGNLLGAFTTTFLTVPVPAEAKTACVPGNGGPTAMILFALAAAAVIILSRRTLAQGVVLDQREV